MVAKETMKFDAEIGKILQLMIHSLYTNKDIFLRELISNGSDACDKLRYLAITNPELTNSDSEFKIQISIDEENHTLIISDNGIGMNKQDLIENLGTIARSGTQNFINQLSGNQKQDMQLIGQFGVGFYSAFMVADSVTVITKKAGQDEAWEWNSKGEGEFSIQAVNKDSRGTIIKLHLKKDQKEFLESYRIRHIVTTYSDHISIPIELLDKENKSEVLNKANALWVRSKSDITSEQYNEFYKHVAHAADEPWIILHNKNEGNIEYTNLLFIPSRKPFDLFHPDRKARVKLYVKRVFITDEGVELVPAYLRFLRGVIDSEDLPLNISRENLQHNNTIDKIKKSVVKKIIGELKKKLKNEREEYIKFWNNFGAVLKEGLCEGIENKQSILEACLFKSALTDQMITLDEYIEKMANNQQDIYYYICEEENAYIKTSPQLEGFLKRNIDVLILSDKVDDFWVNVEHKYKDKELKSVTRANIELDKIDNEIDHKKEEILPNEAETQQVIDYFKNTLGEIVKDVKQSNKLVDSPVCLTVAEGSMDIRMERFLIEQNQLASASSKILEINIKHPIINKISSHLKDDQKKDFCEEMVKLLYDQACVIEGEPIKDVGGFAKRLNNLLDLVGN